MYKKRREKFSFDKSADQMFEKMDVKSLQIQYDKINTALKQLRDKHSFGLGNCVMTDDGMSDLNGEEKVHFISFHSIWQ